MAFVPSRCSHGIASMLENMQVPSPHCEGDWRLNIISFAPRQGRHGSPGYYLIDWVDQIEDLKGHLALGIPRGAYYGPYPQRILFFFAGGGAHNSTRILLRNLNCCIPDCSPLFPPNKHERKKSRPQRLLGSESKFHGRSGFEESVIKYHTIPCFS